ncbi:dihydroorotase [Stratiformator vulcanicus]|uniref:Dihydroorotase n=1 Tax=Stratiformator vulcanicus TaxID=2527980 RepID=A0A517R2E4_9PLAN|nr:dihydroorotase [Stratiformator vulcanicus]QDT38055.1 Dihydroorotase [Stratiformator vulcanicus]
MSATVTQVIRGGRVVDPAIGTDAVIDVVVRDGRIAALTNEPIDADEVIDATGLVVAPGLVDPHVSFREPGDESDETTESGSAAALAGGYTSVACLPDTEPAVDDRAAAEFIALQAERAKNCRVYPLGAVTKGIAGKELAEIGQLVDGGAVAFTDGKHPIQSAEIMRRALMYARMFDRPILAHPQDSTLVAGGVMHEGFISTVLGLRGMPAAAEYISVARDIALAELTESRLHIMCVSTASSVEAVRQAKARGVKVTADLTPHHLCLTDTVLRSYDSRFKVNPPLRSEENLDALIAGLCDGTIDAISADHQPYAEEKKSGDLLSDPFGVSGIETAFCMSARVLVGGGHLTWPKLIRLLSTNPAGVLGIEAGTLQVGRPADLVIFNAETAAPILARNFRSKGKSSPFEAMEGLGRVEVVIVGGEIRYRWPETDSTA